MKKSLVFAAAALFATAGVAHAERDGKTVYDTKCFVCHATGAAGAPKFADKAAWAPRVGQGADTLLATVITGKGAMPPKGLCMDCTDGELKAGVEHMLNAVK